jgi:hypothetical protein
MINLGIIPRNPSNQTARSSINSLATALANRFDARVGCTRSWDASDPTDFQVRMAPCSLTLLSKDRPNATCLGLQVIIDNMMNLELLFVSANLTGNQRLKDIAITHAKTTMNNHIRPDGG